MSGAYSSWGYRRQQLWLALWGQPDERGMARAQQVLTDAEFALFRNLQPGEQAHALNVLHTLETAGHTDPLLLAAALLHDIGKARHRPTIIGRIAIVLGGRFFPAAAARWGAGQPRGLRRPFVIAAQHPAWGADMAEHAGSHPEVVELIAAHQHHTAPAALSAENQQRLHALQAADNAN